jgi:NADPH:quinone reductase-like Zn-dependent oxidoreductase
MKAIFFEQHGGPEVLKYGEIPDPVAKPGEALIKVLAASLNHLDIWVRRGWPALNLTFPHVTGSDIVGEIISVKTPSSSQVAWQAGTVVIVNPGVISSEDEWTRRGQESISPGYKIIGENLPGGLAEYVTVPIENVFRMPDGFSNEEAAASLLVGTTCWRMLFSRGQLSPGETVLVVGSGGGVNSMAIKLSRAIGAYVIALASNANKARRALDIGAHQVIDIGEYPKWELEVFKISKGRGVDLVIDNVGASTIQQSIRSTARGGRIVTVGNTSGHNITFDNRMLFGKQISLIGSTMGSRQDFIDALAFMSRNGIKPIIDKISPLSQGIEALQYLEQGKQFGKIVLRPGK